MRHSDTRLAKVDAADSPFSCILLATAGLVRLGLGHRITQRLDPDVFPYAVGQAALGLEVKKGSEDTLALVRAADHMPSRWCGLAERAMLRSLQGGCSSPIGVRSLWNPRGGEGQAGCDSDGGVIRLNATVLNVEGTKEICARHEGHVSSDHEAERIGVLVAKSLLVQGAGNLLQKQS